MYTFILGEHFSNLGSRLTAISANRWRTNEKWTDYA